MRTLRASEVKAAPEHDRIFIRLGGGVLAAWRTSTFMPRLAEPMVNAPRRPLGPSEAYARPDMLFNVDASWSGPMVEGQDRLYDFDWDDRGYVYLAASFFGWGIIDLEGRSVHHRDSGTDNLTPTRVYALKAGSEYYALLNEFSSSQTLVFNVTNPTTPVRQPSIPFAVSSMARTGGAVAVTVSGSLRIYTPAALLANGTYLTVPFAGQMLSNVISDGDLFYVAGNTGGGSSVVTAWAVTPAGIPTALHSAPGTAFKISHGAGYLALLGRPPGMETDLTALVLRRSAGTWQPHDLTAYLRASYTPKPQNFVAYDLDPIATPQGTLLLASLFGIGDSFQLKNVSRGTGVFTPVAAELSGSARDVVLGDLDGDDDLDALQANDFGQGERVWLNDGHGGFTPHPTTPAFGAGDSTSAVLGDLDDDGDLDAVVANTANAPETVWLNDGTGAFSPHPVTPGFGAGASWGVAIGDLDGDGDLDAVIANNGTAETVWLNDGAGSFSAHPATPSFGTGQSRDVALGDLDGDGDLDAVVANFGEAQTVWLNDGGGNFSAHPTIPSFGGGSSRAVSLGDLDGDGDLDAVVANISNEAETVWLNDGVGGFTAGASFGAGQSTGVGLGDLDDDGDLDAIVTNEGGQAETVWLNGGAGNFTAHPLTSFSSDGSSQAIALGDLDRDGDIDAVIASLSDGPTRAWLNRDPARVTVAPASGLRTTEAGTNAVFQVGLTSKPIGDVSLELTTTAPAEGKLSSDGSTQQNTLAVLFTPANWDTWQTITVHGQNESRDDGDVTYGITTSVVTSADPLYTGLDPADVLVTNVDNDNSFVAVSPLQLTVAEAGTTANFNVVLASEPAGSVVVELATSDSGEAIASPARLTFTSANWATPQTVVVTGVDDADFDDHQTVTVAVTINTASTADPIYAGINPADVTVTVQDDEKASTSISLSSSPNPSYHNQTVSLTATITSGSAGTITGTVTFRNGSIVLGSAPVSNGQASYSASFSAGSYSFTASYGGDPNFSMSSSSPLMHRASSVPPPSSLSATATSSSEVLLSWPPVTGATTYEVWRASSVSGPFVHVLTTSGVSVSESGLSAATTYLYKVRSQAGDGPSPFGGVDAATTIVFTDPALGGVAVKAIHLAELRTAANSIRAAAALPAATYTDAVITAGVTPIRSLHITELRSAINAARATIGLAPTNYSDTSLTAGVTVIRKEHLSELRAGTQ